MMNRSAVDKKVPGVGGLLWELADEFTSIKTVCR
jgi:hypothetical protein